MYPTAITKAIYLWVAEDIVTLIYRSTNATGRQKIEATAARLYQRRAATTSKQASAVSPPSASLPLMGGYHSLAVPDHPTKAVLWYATPIQTADHDGVSVACRT